MSRETDEEITPMQMDLSLETDEEITPMHMDLSLNDLRHK